MPVFRMYQMPSVVIVEPEIWIPCEPGADQFRSPKKTMPATPLDDVVVGAVRVAVTEFMANVP